MNFSNVLNNYIEILNCTSKDLSQSSSLSPAAISRYRNGERIPDYESKQFKNLINGIVKLATEKNINDITYPKVLNEFSETFGKNATDFNLIRLNINTLISTLNINISKMSKNLGFDASYISRITSGQRKPSDIETFVDSICKYIIKCYSNKDIKSSIASLINISIDDIGDNDKYFFTLQKWLYENKTTIYAPINSFLEKLDEFNLDEYIKAIHFDTLKVPSIPFHFSTSKNYYGIEEMKNGELDFFKSTVLSKTKESIFIYNDMPMQDMAKDLDFGKKWMFAIAMSLKKGLHLNMIHNLDRPFNEMMLDLESWIPIYMTGQISPYYFKEKTNNLFYHTLYVSEISALSGDGIKGAHNNAKYYLTSKKGELPYYKNKAECLLKKASPLMQIYTEENIEDFKKFISAEKDKYGNKISEIKNSNLKNTFKNIDFTICEDNWVMLTKNEKPSIHFVIYHPKLRNSIKNFIVPIIEEDMH